MKQYENEVFPSERALYAADGVELKHCSFDGEEDGESALKEGKNILLTDCYFNLRYPLWHDDNVTMTDCEMTDKCRAALWYTKNVRVDSCKMHGIKALRECRDVTIENSDVLSPEFGWRSVDIAVKDSSIEGEYPFFMAKDLTFDNVKLRGKYSFQYTENMTIKNCVFDTKDAFWHSKNVTVVDSVIKGEYLAWYAENLTFINCTIIGTQPLCYCKNLRLVNCKTERCDLSFEYSDVQADIIGEVLSVKNPLSGKIVADSYGEIILADAVYPCDCEILTRK